jgi:adenylate cyclase
MKLSRRDRRIWRLFIFLSIGAAAISAYFGYAIAPPERPVALALFSGAFNSVLIATPILLFELMSARSGPLRRLRHLPLLVYLGVKVLFYAAVIVGGLALARHLVSPDGFSVDETFRDSLVFSIAMSVIANLAIEVGRLLGFGTIKDLLTGRYVRPHRERRAFLLIDMKGSTTLAERLGPLRFHELLNTFFRDVSDAALECDAEIHKYVGDEAILTWTDATDDCLRCPFVVRDLIERGRPTYLARFGVVPEFRAALHYGEVVAGEIGDVRREIAYVGDTLNVAARLLEATKELGRDVLATADLLDRTAMPDGLSAEKLPTLSVRGRAAPLGVSALGRDG